MARVIRNPAGDRTSRQVGLSLGTLRKETADECDDLRKRIRKNKRQIAALEKRVARLEGGSDVD